MPPSVNELTFVEWQTPTGCGGIAVSPGDLVSCDEGGAVLIPAAVVDEMIAKGQAGTRRGLDHER